MKSGVPPFIWGPVFVHTKMYNTIIYDSDESQVEQKPIFHAGTYCCELYSRHSQLEFIILSDDFLAK